MSPAVILPRSLDERVAAARRERRHVVAHADFSGRGTLPSSEAPVTCSCGAVATVRDWPLHLKTAGQRVLSVAQAMAFGRSLA